MIIIFFIILKIETLTLNFFPKKYSLKKYINNQPIQVARAAQYTQIKLISIKFIIKLKIITVNIIFTLSFTFQIQAKILKLI